MLREPVLWAEDIASLRGTSNSPSNITFTFGRHNVTITPFILLRRSHDLWNLRSNLEMLKINSKLESSST